MPERTTQYVMDRLAIMVARLLDRAQHSEQNRLELSMRLLDLAHNASGHGFGLHALDLCRKAQSLSGEAPEVAVRVRRCLGNIVPGYHLPLINDARRNDAWNQALSKAVKPGMRVLEIGTGTGMLALMAARAGAAKVTTCEYHPVVAQIAREIVAANGMQDRIDVICKSSLELRVGVDMSERADLVFCDNFSDNMYSFNPMQSMADARMRLLKAGAVSLPKSASVRAALVRWNTFPRYCQAQSSCGFDVRPAAWMVPEATDMEIGDEGIDVASDDRDIFRLDFGATTFSPVERTEVELRASRDGEINGIVQWIRLQLDDDTVLEAKPSKGTVFFSNPRFYPLRRPRVVATGEPVTLHAWHDATTLSMWLDETVQ